MYFTRHYFFTVVTEFYVLVSKCPKQYFVLSIRNSKTQVKVLKVCKKTPSHENQRNPRVRSSVVRGRSIEEQSCLRRPSKMAL